MKIGIDIDGVLTDFEKWQLEVGSKFFIKYCTFTSSTHRSGLFKMIRNTSSTLSGLPSKHAVMKSSSIRRNARSRSKSCSCLYAICSSLVNSCSPIFCFSAAYVLFALKCPNCSTAKCPFQDGRITV